MLAKAIFALGDAQQRGTQPGMQLLVMLGLLHGQLAIGVLGGAIQLVGESGAGLR